MRNQKLKIEYVPIESVKMYERNAKLHPGTGAASQDNLESRRKGRVI